MTIDRNTRISELIRLNSQSIDAIAALAKPLEKLKNPILRKILASRVTIQEAAKMGGVSLQEFISALSPLGFTWADDDSLSESKTTRKPVWLLNAGQEDITDYDVRPIIDNGADPLKEILGRFKDVEPGKILNVVNSFIPTPLIHLLKKEKAEDAYVEQISEKEYHTYFLKKFQKENSVKTADDEGMMDDAAGFNALYDKYAPANIREIDVRALEMPGPMQAILAELERLPEGKALFIHHKRVPVYLLEELAEKEFDAHIHQQGEGNVKMLILRK